MERSDDASMNPFPPPFRVVRVYFRLPPEPGGMELHIARLSASQRDGGIEVINFYNAGEADGFGVQVLPGFNLSTVRRASLRNAIFYTAALFAQRQLKTVIPTVLHVHGDITDIVYSKVLARAIGAEVVAVSFHDVISRRVTRLYRWALGHCDIVFTTGKNEQLYLQELLDRPVHHLPSAPMDLFITGPENAVTGSIDVITIANFYPKKRLDLVLECASRRPDLRFAVFGDGPTRADIAARVMATGIGNLTLPGRCTTAQIAAAMRDAKLFLLTSEQEGTPTAVLEAMAIGLPVVLTPSNDYNWLVFPGVNGYITPGWDVNDIIGCIDDVLSDESRRIAMGRANRERAAEHTWTANANRVTSLMAQRLGLPCGVTHAA